MNRNIICILIALMVLSISAILIANHVEVIAKIASTLNGTPMTVTLAGDADDTIKTLDLKELRDNWADHDRKFVRFTGTVVFVQKDPRTEKVRRLTLKGNTTHVYPLDAQDLLLARLLPETYELGNTYEFTGLLIRDGEHAPTPNSRNVTLRIYAVQANNLGKAK